MFLYFRSLLLIIISLYTTREILKVLGVDDYGIYQLIGGMVTMFALLGGSMSSASQRFITYALGREDREDIKKVFATSITLHIIIGIMVVFILEVVGGYFLYNHLEIPDGRLTAAFWTLQCSILAFYLNIISIPYNSLIIAHERMEAFAYLSILDGVLKLLSVYLLYIIHFDKLVVYSVAILVSSSLIRLLYTIYCKKQFEEAKQVKFGIEKRFFKEMAAFAGWNIWGSGSAVLRNQGVDIFMNMFFGVTVNAAKGLCNQVQNAVYQFVTNFQSAVNPQLTKSVAQHDLVRIHALIFQGSRFSFYLLMLLSVPLILHTQYVLSLWLVEIPDYTVHFIQWTMVYLLFDTQSRFLVTSIMATGEIRNYQIVVGGVKLLALPIIYVCFKLGLGPLAGIWVNVLLECVCLTLRLRYNNKLLKINIEHYIIEVFLRCWSVFVMAMFVSWLLMEVFPLHSLWTILISVFISTGTIYAMGMKGRERRFVSTKVIKAIAKIRR